MRTVLRENPGTLRLVAIRFAGQFGDGMFQAALSGAILFNPERQADPAAIAAGFAVLLLPYSLIGPYAGALLDRWDRRAVLLVATILRAIVIAMVSVGLLVGVGQTVLLLLALTVVGVSRFVLAGVSAALPRVLAPARLVPMNSVFVTVASVCGGLGAASAVGTIGLIGAGDFASAVAVAGSGVGSLAGAMLAGGFGSGVLGPISVKTTTVRAVTAGLRTGATAVWESISVTTAMTGIGAHRIVFGANTLVMVLVLRQDPAGGSGFDAGLIGFGIAVAATAAGMLAAAAIAPLLIPRLGRARTVLAGLIAAMLVQVTLVTPIAVADSSGALQRAHHLLLIGAFLLGLAGQTIKLTGDATMQIVVDDGRRGQVFALQDTVFNTAFVVALVAAALVVPDDGRSLAVVLAGVAVYATAIAAIALNSTRRL
ncbi:hypothetical protein [Nocardia sp. CNY236]|uniref:hypothetical protein n=1 Tax=Nocardia sp. CNY236 TaxID=1169152 RepID=UPI0006849FD0|nr:hypothetical protein [Nocardia sp. CNY236]